MSSDLLRFRLKSTAIISSAPTVISYPAPRKAGDPPLMEYHGMKHYVMPSSGFRGKTRRRVFKNVVNKCLKVDPKFTMTSADVRLMILGGVKGSGKGDHLSPKKAMEVRHRRPDIDIYGCNDPTFMAGCLAPGMTVSIDPVLADKIDPDSTIPIIRRTLLNDSILRDVEISDLGSMDDLREMNQQRSKLTESITRLKRATRKENPTAAEKRDIERQKATISEIMGVEFTSIDDAEIYLDKMKASMRDEGHSDVSEANLQTAGTIPAGTRMQQIMYLNYITKLGAGLFLWGWHDAYVFDPAIGGMAARGAGGYLTSDYMVERQEGYDWIEDCRIKIEPDKGLTFLGSNSQLANSQLREAFEAWRDVDIRNYDFTFAGLKKFIGGEE